MDELLVRCYGILGIAGNASRQEAAQAFEALKRRYQGIDFSHRGEGRPPAVGETERAELGL